MRLTALSVPLVVVCMACGADESTASSSPTSDAGASASGSGGNVTVGGSAGGEAGRSEVGGASPSAGGGVASGDAHGAGGSGGQGGTRGAQDASLEGSSSVDGAPDGRILTGTCSGSADCNGATCCGSASNSRMCVASPAQCPGLIYCKLPADCPDMDHCCPQGFCGGCD